MQALNIRHIRYGRLVFLKWHGVLSPSFPLLPWQDLRPHGRYPGKSMEGIFLLYILHLQYQRSDEVYFRFQRLPLRQDRSLQTLPWMVLFRSSDPPKTSLPLCRIHVWCQPSLLQALQLPCAGMPENPYILYQVHDTDCYNIPGQWYIPGGIYNPFLFQTALKYKDLLTRNNHTNPHIFPALTRQTSM